MMMVASLRRRVKYLRKYFNISYGEKIRTNNAALVIAVTIAAMLLPGAASAQVVISEIMYDTPGTEGSGDHDWIEVFNAGPSSVDLSTYRFFEAGTNHTLKVDQGSATLSVGGYAVIANIPATFKTDWPSYTGALFDSSFNLNSVGELIGIRTGDLADSDVPFTYAPQDAATDNGSSLQRTSVTGVTFTASSPTPGITFSGDSSGDSSDSSDTSTTTTTVQSSSSGSSSGDSIMPPPPKVFADGGSDRTVIVGADTEFKARAYDEKKNSIDFSRFHWNFGDGSTSEVGTVPHRFDYPGRYAVVLTIPEEKDSVPDQITVTVELMKLALSLMQDGGVAIENRAGRTLDLSRWIIQSMGRTFTVPDRTFILAGATLRISQKTLGFSSGSEIELAYPGGGKALGLAPEPTPAPAPVPSPAVAETSAPRGEGSQRTPTAEEDRQTPEEPAAPVADIEPTPVSEATSSQVAAAGTATEKSSPLWWFGAFGIASLAAGSLALARRFGKKEWDIEEMSETR